MHWCYSEISVLAQGEKPLQLLDHCCQQTGLSASPLRNFIHRFSVFWQCEPDKKFGGKNGVGVEMYCHNLSSSQLKVNLVEVSYEGTLFYK